MQLTARTPREAIRQFVEVAQRSVSCVTDSVIEWRRTENPTLGLQDRRLAMGCSVRLRGETLLSLRIGLQFQVKAGTPHSDLWGIGIVAYFYSLADVEKTEILGYQWHPVGPSSVKSPHLHLGPAARVGRRELMRAHLPTGHIDLNDFLPLLIREFRVRARQKDWAGILGTN